MKNIRDLYFMDMAYSLAERAKGWASPNPYVGAVVVKNGKIIGCGYHEKPGKSHAEIIALKQAKNLAVGSTLYVTLEPCVHWGRTPPCVDIVLKAKPRRVVISALDPNPLVYKKGIKKLREEGIDVSVGLLSERNARLNETYVKYITQKIPFVTLKAAISLDGKMATKSLDSRWISSPETREYVHLLRGECDALMAGVNTILRDDPRLTVRHPNWKGKKIVRVILDSHLRLPLHAKILSTLGQGKICVFTLKGSSPRKKAALEKKGVEVHALAVRRSNVPIEEVLSHLGRQEIASVLVEGGSALLTAILERGLADKMFLTISPKLVGGERAPTLFEGKGVASMRDSLRLEKKACFQIGEDIVWEGYF